MKLLIKNILLFCIIGLLFGEVISRIFSTTSDIPNRIIDKNNIQKYEANQTGNWIGGTHSWLINEEGWPGKLPNSKDNLITIIGDSYIENFMNPDSCRQSVLLKKLLPKNNFYEASRSGVSFIEAIQMASYLDSLQPIQQLVYVHDSDFLESVIQIKRIPDITQYDSNNEKIIPGILRSPGFKKILYNWKFMFYLYSNYSFGTKSNKDAETNKKTTVPKSLTVKSKYELNKLLTYVNETYKKSNITLIYRPNGDPEILALLKKHNFKVVLLVDNKEKDWSFEHDAHWTCIGHAEAAKQIAINVKKIPNI